MTKKCTKCSEDKELENFYRQKAGRFGVCSVCKVCQRELANKWNKENKERFRANLYKWRAENPQRLSEISKKSWHKNSKNWKEKRREWEMKNKDHLNAWHREWYMKNPEKVKMWAKRKYERMRQENLEKMKLMWKEQGAFRRLKGTQSYKKVPLQYLQELKEATKNCPYCENEIIEYHLDHMVPLTRGGEHVKENLTFCCKKCNLSKNNKTVPEFMEYLKKLKSLNVLSTSTATAS